MRERRAMVGTASHRFFSRVSGMKPHEFSTFEIVSALEALRYIGGGQRLLQVGRLGRSSRGDDGAAREHPEDSEPEKPKER